MFLLVWYVVLPLLVPTILGMSANDPDGKSPPNRRVKRIEKSDLCDIKDYPCLVAATKISLEEARGKVVDPDKIRNGRVNGALITMDWFLTGTAGIMVMKAELGERWTILAGTNLMVPQKYDNIARYNKVTDYSSKSINLVDDELSLCQISEPFGKLKEIQPANLPTSPQIFDVCKTLTVVGWGKAYDYGDSRDYVKDFQRHLWLTQAQVRIIECHGPIKLFSNVTSNYFCVQLIDENQKFCRGDVGQPIFCDNYTLVGIFQRAYSTTDSECSRTGYATNITQYMTWLRKTTGVNVVYESEPVYNITTTEVPTETDGTTSRRRKKRKRKTTSKDDDDDIKNYHRSKKKKEVTTTTTTTEQLDSGVAYFSSNFCSIVFGILAFLLVTRL